MRLETKSGLVFCVCGAPDAVTVAITRTNSRQYAHGELTPSEALELAAELVKLAMPDATKDTSPVSIM